MQSSSALPPHFDLHLYAKLLLPPLEDERAKRRGQFLVTSLLLLLLTSLATSAVCYLASVYFHCTLSPVGVAATVNVYVFGMLLALLRYLPLNYSCILFYIHADLVLLYLSSQGCPWNVSSRTIEDFLNLSSSWISATTSSASYISQETSYFCLVPLMMFFTERFRVAAVGYILVNIQIIILFVLQTITCTDAHAIAASLSVLLSSLVIINVVSSIALAFSYARISVVAHLEHANADMARLLRELEESNVSLQRATEAKSRFVANMTHELRTPMHGIIGMSEHLLTEHKAVLRSNNILEPVQIVAECAEHLLSLLTDILDYSRLDCGRMKMESVIFSVTAQVAMVEQVLLPLAGLKHLKLIVNTFMTTNEHRKGDPIRFKQLLFNLIGNAIKFTGESGVVEVSVYEDVALGQQQTLDKFDGWEQTYGVIPSKDQEKEEEVESDLTLCEEETVFVAIKDTGIGMRDGSAAALFQSFSQVDTEVNRKFEGSGLGLSICKKLVTALGGRIGVKSKENQGSLFWFTLRLPIEQPVLSSPQGPSLYSTLSSPKEFTHRSGKSPLTGLKILVVEDNKVNQRITKRMLDTLGCEVKIAENGKEAVDAVKAEHFDGVLMDINMPVMDGFEATRTIRQNEELQNTQLEDTFGDLAVIDREVAQTVTTRRRNSIPILALTASNIHEYQDRCKECGMDDILAKPLKRAELLRVFPQHLRYS